MMMTVLDQATRRRAVQAFFVLLLVTFSCYALASNSPLSGNVKSRKCSPDVKVHDRTERKLAAAAAPEPAISGNASPQSRSNRRRPSPPPNSRPAPLSPGDDNTPGTDLPPRTLSPSPASEAPTTSPSKRSEVFIVVGTFLLIVFLVGLSFVATAYWCPESLPCCKGRIAPVAEVPLALG